MTVGDAPGDRPDPGGDHPRHDMPSWTPSEVVAPFAIAAWLAAGIVLSDRFLLAEGTRAWLLWAAAATLLVGSTVYQFTTARGRRVRRDRAALVDALMNRTDPGPRLRERADHLAVALARFRRLPYLLPLVPFGLLPLASGRPWLLVLVAGLVAVAVPVAGAVALSRQAGAARRWLTHPPGPSLDAPQPRPVDRWLTGRRLLLVGVVGLAVVGLGILLGLLTG